MLNAAYYIHKSALSCPMESNTFARNAQMKGKEALRVFNQVKEITSLLLAECENEAFFRLGELSERMATIVGVDDVSFNPTVNINEKD
jgi:hypothetical protein